MILETQHGFESLDGVMLLCFNDLTRAGYGHNILDWRSKEGNLAFDLSNFIQFSVLVACLLLKTSSIESPC